VSIVNLRLEQQKGAIDLLSTLRLVEINPVDVCNRSCSFCPRSDPTIYTNRKWVIKEETTTKLANDLKDIGFNNRIGFVGMGEPTLHKNLSKHLHIISSIVNPKWLEINTNGDFLTTEKIKEYADSGCTHICVSMYDCDISDRLFEMANNIDVEIIPRHCYPDRFELDIIDRANNITQQEIPNITNPCYMPFYQLYVDWDGNILVCQNDWGRKGIIGNIKQSTIKDIWLGKEFNKYRKELQQGKRYKLSPCNTCNIQGTRYGKESFEIMKNARLFN